MKVIVAIDSFKGSLTSMEAGRAAMEGILRAKPEAKVLVRPLADGGEGTAQALVEGLGGEYVSVTVTGPLGKMVQAKYGILSDRKTAVIEMAEAAGLTLVPEGERNPLDATTYGVGEMILDAVKRGCREFIVGIGGSATVDGGVGMLQALGFLFTDKDGNSVGSGIRNLDKIAEISSERVPEEILNCHFQVACDVQNPLCGENGAVYIFGAQKGVKEEQKQGLEEKMRHYADKTAAFAGRDNQEKEGAGAAGGLGFAFFSYLPKTELKSGIDIVLQAAALEADIREADVIVTGEGRLDAQTAMGKAPVGVARLAKKYGKRVLAFAGSLGEGADKCNEEGIDAFFSVVPGVRTLEEAMNPENARKNIALTAEQIFHLL